jgi:hypothetical protein
MKMKASRPSGDLQTRVNGTETIGLTIGAGQEDYHVGVGWNYSRRILVGNNASVTLEWPTADFFNVRVGTNPPFFVNQSADH